jgi:PTS system mannose-specific IIA component
MIGVIVATHGLMAKEMLNSAAMLVGEGEQMGYVCLLPGQDPDDFLAKCEEAVTSVDTGDGVVALVDIPGGTPNNTMFRLSKSHSLRIVTGVNLPMVMLCVLERYDGQTADELVETLLSEGQAAVTEFGKR